MLDEKEIKEASRKAKRRLSTLSRLSDQEDAHYEADAVLVDLLRDLGFDEVVCAYEKIEKWYA